MSYLQNHRKVKLFPYQEVGRDFLAVNKTCLLADSPRLGKSVQTITAVDKINAQTVLIVCRAIARANWQFEFEKWSGRKWNFIPIYNQKAEINFSSNAPNLVITSYECLKTVLEKMEGKKFDVSVVDESHYVKEPTAKRTQLVFGKENLPVKTRRLWLLTGTPICSHYAELWTALFSFGATQLSYWNFAKRFCIVKDTGFGTVIASNNTDPARIEELQKIMEKKILRREPEDVSMQLPKISMSTVMVPPGKVDLALTVFWKYAKPYNRIAELNELIEKELQILNGIMESGKMSDELLETLKAQSKSISTLRRYTALQKLEPALELIMSELDAGAYHKCVIFAHHRDCILGAAQYLYKYFPVTMYGGTNPRRLEKNLKNFQNPKHKTRVFIGQISAAGTSISLSAANHVFFLEESFVPSDNLQAAQRCGGINQPNPIFVRTFCLENSYDKRVQQILMQKMNEIAKVYKKNNSQVDNANGSTGKNNDELPADMI